MGPTAYALCQNGIIGPAMWIVGLCVFPPLIGSTALPLQTAGIATSSSFTVPVDKSYQFLLEFEFASTEARLQDKIVGNNYAAGCQSNPMSLAGQAEYGRPIPIRVVIRRANDSSVVVDSKFVTLCLQSHSNNRKSRSIGWVTLARGEYTAELTNLAAQDGLTHTRTSFSLVPGGRK
ncbi:DUF5625 family protein [Paucibacter sp. DJ2R-2]|uniref:DUF5625 family protein n=1 Tax=Paucibacter sp. DJ2R-2 TaxID=2893558 RepID=UPI00398CCEA3